MPGDIDSTLPCESSTTPRYSGVVILTVGGSFKRPDFLYEMDSKWLQQGIEYVECPAALRAATLHVHREVINESFIDIAAGF